MDLCAYHNVGGYHNIYLCGLPYNSAEVREDFPLSLPKKKQNQVIYSSRWDTEKDPGFFMDVIEECIKQNIDVHFVITTSSDKLRSNDPKLLERLGWLIDGSPDYIEVRTGCTKEEYYYSLLESKIQMNTADQDFVSWTLLEATTCRCRPLYPNFLSFPEALHNDYSLMYEKRDIKSAVTALRKALATPLIDYSHIYKPFDDSWKRMLSVMTQDFNFWLENPLFED
jgi:hypothetical protein